MSFNNKLINRIEKINSHVCVGLDSRYDYIPDNIKAGKSISNAIFEFNKKIISSTHHVATTYKITLTFYRGFGMEGIKGLLLTTEYLKSNFPEIILIADYKTSDMGESAKMMKKEVFDFLKFDCIMMTPWFGQDTVGEFLKDESHGVAIYVHDSNPTAPEYQDLKLASGKKLYEEVAYQVAHKWNTNGNVFVEAAITFPVQLKRTREIVGEDMVILTAGIGTQGGRIKDLKGVFGKNGKRLLVNSSRDIIFAGKDKKDYFLEVKKAAESLHKKLLSASLLE